MQPLWNKVPWYGKSNWVNQGTSKWYLKLSQILLPLCKYLVKWAKYASNPSSTDIYRCQYAEIRDFDSFVVGRLNFAKIFHLSAHFWHIFPNISNISADFNYFSIIHEVHGNDKLRTAFGFILARTQKKWQPQTSKKPFGQWYYLVSRPTIWSFIYIWISLLIIYIFNPDLK